MTMIVMERRARDRVMAALLRPPILALGFLVKLAYRLVFGWWLDPLLQRRWNKALLEDIKSNLPFLFSDSDGENKASLVVRHADWPTIEVLWGNLLFTIVRWRDETYVSVAPRSVPTKVYKLGRVVDMLERGHPSEHTEINDLVKAGHLLRPRLIALNSSFSQEEFPRTEGRL
jgi:hypothetical protein